MDVLGHDGHTLGVDGAQVRVLEETDEVSLRRLLQRTYGCTLEPQIGLEILRDLTNEALERELAQEKLRGLLVSTNFAQCYGARAVAMGLLDTACVTESMNLLEGRKTNGTPRQFACSGRRFAGCLGGESFSWRLASGRLTGGLLRSGHLREGQQNAAGRGDDE